jgi:hypothetical protein
MNIPSSGQLHQPDNWDQPELGRARELLQLSLSSATRPIDELLLKLEEPDGRVWLLNSIPEHIDRAELTHLLLGKLPLYAVIERKDQSKTGIVEAATKNESLAAMAVYCLCVAAGIVHFNRLISTQSWRTWQAFLADLADVAPDEWRPLLFDAAVKVEHAEVHSA